MFAYINKHNNRIINKNIKINNFQIYTNICVGLSDDSGGNLLPCSSASSSRRSLVSIALNTNVKLCLPIEIILYIYID